MRSRVGGGARWISPTPPRWNALWRAPMPTWYSTQRPTTRWTSPKRSPWRLTKRTRLVHFSTDYVFDGRARHPYIEDDPTHPLGAYAVSKLAGELYAQAYLDRAIVVRTSGVFGPGGMDTARGNFVELMLRLAGTSQAIRVVEDHVASPTYAPLLAARTVDLVDRGLSGLFHIGGGFPISWFQFARTIFELAGLEPLLLATNEREYRNPAQRPKYSALSNAKIERLGLEPMPPLREVLAAYLAERSRKSQ